MRAPALALGLTLVALAPAAAQTGDPGAGQRRTSRPEDEAFARVDRSQFDVSAATGGDVYLWAPGEFAVTGPVPISTDPEALLLAHGELARGGTRELVVPVDAGVGQVSFFLSVQGKEWLQVVDPGGALLAAGPGVTLAETRHMLIAKVSGPRRGAWRLSLGGRGLYSLSARASRRPGEPPPVERIALLDVDFVQPGGRPGHEGLFPVRAAPRAGAVALARASLAGAASDLEMTFVDAAGEPLGRCRRRPTSPETRAPGNEDALFECRVPAKPFRVVVTGLDPEGSPFRRVDSPLRSPSR